jgi:hypothetical protein
VTQGTMIVAMQLVNKTQNNFMNKKESIELTTHQSYLQRQIRYYFKSKLPEYKITLDDGVYFHANNGKRFFKFNLLDFKEQVAFMNIREDGDTRTVYNGFFKSLDQFKTITESVW